MNATSEIVSEFLLYLNISVITDRKNSAKVLLRIEDSIYTEMNLKVQ